jgi:hypothetical protein
MRTSPAGTVTARGFFGDYAADGEPFTIQTGHTETTVALPA